MQNKNVCRDVTDVFLLRFFFFCVKPQTSFEREDEQWFYYSNHIVCMVLVVKHGKEMA